MLKVSVSGIRGIWGDSLTHENITGYTKSFVSLIGAKKRIAVASDTRKTRDIIKKMVHSILESYECEIIDLGVVPTPLLLFAVKDQELDGGIMISASHNPAQWNALKLVKKGGFFLNQGEMDQIQENFEKENFLSYSYNKLGQVNDYPHIVKDYLERVEPLVDVHAIREREFKVVVDAVNGTAVQFAHALLYFLNAEHSVIFADTSKEFERGAEPLPDNLTALKEAVIKEKADLGLAYDPDADRLALVDENGRAVGEDWTLAVAYLNFLEKKKSDIVVNLSTSMIIDMIARENNATVHRAKVGEINVTEKMLELGAEIGGEGNGGVIYPKINFCRDSLIATLMVLEYLAKSKKKLSEVVAAFPAFFPVKDKVPFKTMPDYDQLETEMSAFLKDNDFKISEVNREDGIRIDYDRGWIQVRASNTEPIIRIMGESTTEGWNEKLLEYVRELVQR